jgi:hypothetical protein
MTVVVLGLVLAAILLRVLGRLCGRALARRPQAAAGVIPSQPAGPEVDSLDDAAFRRWLGVLPATYDRYVDTGVEDVEIYLADQPVRRVGEDPAGPPA